MLKSFRGIHIFAASALLATTLVPLAARAADMPMAPPLDAYDDERVTFGTGWYLRGDIAAANDVKLTIGNVSLPNSSSFFNSFSGGIGFGYKYNEWLRSDVTVDVRNPRRFSGNTMGPLQCQSGAAPVYGVDQFGNQTVVGSTPVYGRCYDYSRARIANTHVLFNVYGDLGTWYGITPYIGGGIGFNNVYQKASQNWYFSNSTPYAPVWTDPYTGGTYSAYWDQSRSTSSLEFAWAAMAGASYAIDRHVAIDLGYRFLGLGDIKTYTAFGGSVKKTQRAQDLRIGLRYTPD